MVDDKGSLYTYVYICRFVEGCTHICIYIHEYPFVDTYSYMYVFMVFIEGEQIVGILYVDRRVYIHIS